MTSTLVGGKRGFKEGYATASRLEQPKGLVATSPTTLYVADTLNHCIRKIENGTITTVAGDYHFPGHIRGIAPATFPGHVDGTGSNARFHSPRGLAVRGNSIIVADTENNAIRIVYFNGTVATLAGGDGYHYRNGVNEVAQFRRPTGVAVNGTDVFVADSENNVIRLIRGGVTSTFAGSGIYGIENGPAMDCRFKHPSDVIIMQDGWLAVADAHNHVIRKVEHGIVSTFVGKMGQQGYANGYGTNAQFHYPVAVTVDTQGTLYVSDAMNHRIRLVTKDGLVSTLVGKLQGSRDGSTLFAALLDRPHQVAVFDPMQVWIADSANDVIRKVQYP
eukprot:jgi/Bigna1/44189/e_gw1.90.25.1